MQIKYYQVFFLSLFLLVWLLSATTGAPQSHQPASSQAGNGDEEIILPFLYDPPMTPIPVIQVSINGEPPLPFMLDTGCNAPIVISTWAAEKLKLQSTGEPIQADAGHSELRRTELRSIELAGGRQQKQVGFGASAGYIMDFQVAAKMFARPRIAGIIGIPLWASSAVQFDFASRTLTVFAHPHVAHGPRTTTLPMSQQGDGYFVRVSSQEGVAADLLVDTGSTATNFPLAAASRLHPQATMTDMWLSADGALHITDKSLVSGLNIGEFVVDQVVVGSIPSADVPKVGLDVLSRFRVTLDFVKSLLILERPADYPQRVHLPGWTGIHLVQRDGKTYAESVEAGSGAERAHVRSGDRILVVDTQRLDPLPISVAQHLLDGMAGSTAQITMRRHDGRVLRTACARQNEFANAHRVNLGLTMEKTAGGPMVIVNVDAASPAEKQGLRKADVIVVWNGQPTASMTPEQFRTQVRTPKISLIVRREGVDAPRLIHLDMGRIERTVSRKRQGASGTTLHGKGASGGGNP